MRGRDGRRRGVAECDACEIFQSVVSVPSRAWPGRRRARLTRVFSRGAVSLFPAASCDARIQIDRRAMDPDELDELVLEGHGGAIEDAADADDPDADRRTALERRLKCEVIAVAEEVARERGESGIRVSPQFMQCIVELTWSYAETLASDVHAFANHRNGKKVNHEDVLLAVRNVPIVKEAATAALPSSLRRKRQSTLDAALVE
jgi:centromere protein S